eukprot:gene13877-16401_t
MADQHAANVLGTSNDVVHTPNLDALARQGIRMELALTLNAAGYESVLAGSMNFHNDTLYGFRNLNSGDPTFQAKKNDILNTMHTSVVAMRNGKGHSDDIVARRDPLAPLPPADSLRKMNGFLFRQNDMHWKWSHKVTLAAVEFLEQRSPTDKPFFLLVSYQYPHRHFGSHPEGISSNNLGNILSDTITGMAAQDPVINNYQSLRSSFHYPDPLPADFLRKVRTEYYACITWLDSEVGMIMTAHQGSRVANNTLAIYTSDHGENLGDHGLLLKHTMFEGAVRVPLIISWPERWSGGQRLWHVCSLLDVAQTVVDAAKALRPRSSNGQSMLALLDGPGAATWKNVVRLDLGLAGEDTDEVTIRPLPQYKEGAQLVAEGCLWIDGKCTKLQASGLALPKSEPFLAEVKQAFVDPSGGFVGCGCR